jgi:hypothetical protein
MNSRRFNRPNWIAPLPARNTFAGYQSGEDQSGGYADILQRPLGAIEPAHPAFLAALKGRKKIEEHGVDAIESERSSCAAKPIE